MTTLREIEQASIAALKSGDRTRLDILRMFINSVKNVAKNDGNRPVEDADVITAGSRMIKQAKETQSFLPADDLRSVSLNAEIAVVEEFLPQKISREKLTKMIEGFLKSAPEGKAARGFVMKELNGNHRGEFDNAVANEILVSLIG